MSLSIKAEAMGGDSINRTAERMQILADRVGADIVVEFNGVSLHAVPGGNARWLEEGYFRELRRIPAPGFRMAFSHTPPASGIVAATAGETRSEAQGLDPEDESAVPSDSEGDAQ